MRSLCAILVLFFVVLSTGTGPAAGQITATFIAASDKSFGRPHDLVLSPDAGHLYVADLDNHVVKVLDPNTLETLGTVGAGHLSAPHDVAFDNEGRLLVADSGNDRIARFEVKGTEWRYLDELTEALSLPEGVSVAPDGRIYVTNARSHTVVVFRDGERIAMAGRRGNGPNQYVRPHDIHVDRDGRVYVSDPGNNRLQVLDPDLKVVGELGGPAYDFNEPKYFDIDSRGLLIVADEYNNKIKILDGERRIVGIIGTGEKAEGPGVFNWPEGVEVKGADMWISDTRNNRIVLYRLEGLETAVSE